MSGSAITVKFLDFLEVRQPVTAGIVAKRLRSCWQEASLEERLERRRLVDPRAGYRIALE